MIWLSGSSPSDMTYLYHSGITRTNGSPETHKQCFNLSPPNTENGPLSDPVENLESIDCHFQLRFDIVGLFPSERLLSLY